MVLPETILGQILQIFRSEGIERHSEGELIERLGIDEDDYNALFTSKADMVQKVIRYDLELSEQRDKELLQHAENPVEEIFLLLLNGIKELRSISPAYIIDMQQYYPQVWQMCLDHLNSYNHDLNYTVINKGVVQGYFRKDINLQLVTKIILEQFNMIINPVVFPPDRYDMGEVFRSVYLYYVRGLCTDQGSRLAENYFSRNNI
ncbi:TetR/AcrR family transcriptional regulator [Pontibacter anaerobius]|uniref:TetR/AcrR family transcriptional regulator n=1 Tax=Pontibacter anaerobius TaxID=2993940 RepID=A0ABT3RGD8_9BACT|nr:TetR/AcrR family transcriptional regulator [Pontibacter anaerobius]MCX2740625.1 TetR/AcrR family transcriptional regulator [Pontibacter anaerobius]